MGEPDGMVRHCSGHLEHNSAKISQIFGNSKSSQTSFGTDLTNCFHPALYVTGTFLILQFPANISDIEN
jgi:hypothetical protein